MMSIDFSLLSQLAKIAIEKGWTKSFELFVTKDGTAYLVGL